MNWAEFFSCRLNPNKFTTQVHNTKSGRFSSILTILTSLHVTSCLFRNQIKLFATCHSGNFVECVPPRNNGYKCVFFGLKLLGFEDSKVQQLQKSCLIAQRFRGSISVDFFYSKPWATLVALFCFIFFCFLSVLVLFLSLFMRKIWNLFLDNAYVWQPTTLWAITFSHSNTKDSGPNFGWEGFTNTFYFNCFFYLKNFKKSNLRPRS